MKVRELHPDWISTTNSDLLERIPFDILLAVMDSVVTHYNGLMSLAGIINSIGRDTVSAELGEQQIHCVFIEHGSRDTNKSARYYTHNRETGAEEEAVYCYRCGRMLTTFWYFFRHLKDQQGLNLREYLQTLDGVYGLPFPRDLVLNFDPDTYYSFEASKGDGVGRKLAHITAMREMRAEDPEAYSNFVRDLWVSGGRSLDD